MSVYLAAQKNLKTVAVSEYQILQALEKSPFMEVHCIIFKLVRIH